jgi:mono/diheme cytochrome c family protein
MQMSSPVLNASPSKARRQGDHPALAVVHDPDRGAQLYRRNCSACHGARGEGDGAGASGLHPRPSNLAENEYTLERLGFALWNGVAGTAMPAWRDISQRDLSAVADLVRGFYAPRQEPAIPASVLELGERVYAAHCAQCHGEKGAGDGSAVGELPIVPTNFVTQRPSLAASLSALRNGIEGTPMAPWSAKLSEAELSAVAYFVRGFYQPDNPR